MKFIDGAMEAIHLQAANTGGQYTHEQRLIMKYVVNIYYMAVFVMSFV